MEQSAAWVDHVDTSWWPEELVWPLACGELTHAAQKWCSRWYEAQTQTGGSMAPDSSIFRWLLLDTDAFTVLAENVGLALKRDEIRCILDKDRLQDLRSELGTQRLTDVISKFPAIKIRSEILSSPPPTLDFLGSCRWNGLQLGVACARKIGAPMARRLQLRMPRSWVVENTLALNHEEIKSVEATVEFFLKHREEALWT